MPISRYPRIGQSLAPALLRPILEVPCRGRSGLDRVIGKETLLADLDEKTWDRFDVRTCILLGREIASKVGRSAYTLVKDPTSYRLPQPLVKFSIEQLELEIRTYRGLNILREKKGLRSPRDWHRLTASDLLELPHFGAKSLVDFLVSYEAMIDPVLESVRPHQFTIDAKLLQKWLDDPIVPIPAQILRSRLPPFPSGVSLESLPLLIRTYNSLRKSRHADDLSSLSELPINELFQIRGFGLECFKDIVSALLRTSNASTTSIKPLPCRTLEEEFYALISAVTSKRNPNKNIEIVFRFFNLDGKRETTLRKLGSEHGLTGERIRQVCDRTTMLLHRRKQATPLLDEALSIVARQLPGAAEEIETSLFKAGLSTGPYRLEGLIEAAKLFGRDVPFSIDASAGYRIALASEQLSLAERAFRTANSAMRKWGPVPYAIWPLALKNWIANPYLTKFSSGCWLV